jgi:sphingomyelin phosphodiesterase
MEYIRDMLKPDMIIWTGDNVPHEIWDQSFENNLNATKTVTELIRKTIPGVPLYPIQGNHEYFPANL